MKSSSRRQSTSIEMHLPCRFDRLPRMREMVEHCCREAGLPSFKTAKFIMAVDEACANIIEHSYEGPIPPEQTASHPGFFLHVSHKPGSVTVDIIDFGEGFSPDALQPVTPRQFVQRGLSRGLGLYIITSFSDSTTYRRSQEEGNLMRLTATAS